MRDIRALRIGARAFSITWDAELATELGNIANPENDQPCYGVVALSDRRVILNPDYNTTADGTMETLLHECIHICEPFLGQTIDHDTLDALANLLSSLLIQSRILVPGDLSIAGVPLTKCRQSRASADET